MSRAGAARVAILIAGAGLGLAAGSSSAERAEREAPGARGSGVREATQNSETAQRLPDRRQLLQQQRREWWTHVREALFTDLELGAEQARGVDAIIETQLATRARFQELDVELRASRRQADTQRSGTLRAEFRAVQAQLKERHELIEEMRALLSEEQRPTFDMNRARLVAEGKKPWKAREGEGAKRPKADEEVKTE